MAAQAGLAGNIESIAPEFTGDMRYVARQPILDLQGRVHGYDLLFRNAPEVVLRRDAELAMQTMLDNEVIFGLERLTNGLPAFITCTAEALTGELGAGSLAGAGGSGRVRRALSRSRGLCMPAAN